MSSLTAKPLSQSLFASFGEVIETGHTPSMMINDGLCARYHDLAQLDFGAARAGISVFHASIYTLPHTLKLVERHPLGSQAFVPLTNDPFLVIVAGDDNGEPAQPQAFITNGCQGVNYHRNTWHGVLTPIGGSGLFAVIDRIGDGNNLQEFHFKQPYTVTVPETLSRL